MMDAGHVLVMSCGANESRLAFVLRQIAATGLAVVRGPDLGGSPSFAQNADAAALLVPSGAQGWPDWHPHHWPLDRFDREGQVVFVNLDAVPKAPPAGGEATHFDLADWTGDASIEFDRLIAQLRVLVATRHSDEFNWRLEAQVGTATSGITELQSLTDRIGRIGDALSDRGEQSRPLRETLDEIGGTYRVVKSAVERFVAAGLSPGGPDAHVFAGLALGPLATQIRNGRGHCRRIGLRYERVGGLRDGLAGKLTPEIIADLDQTFERLANADGDVFSAMDGLGQAMTNESQIILRHLLTGRIEQARQHAKEAIERLLPLNMALEDALAAFQVVASAVGYAESTPIAQEIAYMTKIEILGDVINSTVVAAQTIANSQIAIKSSEASQDLKVALERLHEATKDLVSYLSADDAALAAKDLKDLSEQAVSPKPNRSIWLRSANGLVAAAKAVGEAGIVVVDLVGKVAGLYGYPLGS